MEMKVFLYNADGYAILCKCQGKYDTTRSRTDLQGRTEINAVRNSNKVLTMRTAGFCGAVLSTMLILDIQVRKGYCYQRMTACLLMLEFAYIDYELRSRSRVDYLEVVTNDRHSLPLKREIVESTHLITRRTP